MIEAIETTLMLLLSAFGIVTALGFVIFRQPVYAALSFAAAVLAGAGLYIMQNAPYVAAATMVIYAGATIIIFLFVLMFAQHSHLQPYELKYSNLAVSIVASLCLILLLGYAATTRAPLVPGRALVAPQAAQTQVAVFDPAGAPAAVETTQPGAGSVAALGRVMYTRYLWSVELAGTLLLVAAGGAIVIAKQDSHSAMRPGESN